MNVPLLYHIFFFLFPLPDPCKPQNLAATVNCDMQVVSLNWDSSNGTKAYQVSADAGEESVSLSTNITTTHFFEFTCGQNYSLTVTPHSQHCPGNASASAFVQTCTYHLNFYFTDPHFTDRLI